MLIVGRLDGYVLQSTTDFVLFLVVSIIKLLQGCPYFCLQIPPSHSLGTFMAACRSMLCLIAVLPLFWHARVFKLFSLYMLKTMRKCETN